MTRDRENSGGRAVRLGTFPIPARYITLPAVVAGASVAALTMAEARNWAFVSTPLLSSTPRGTLQILGPLMAVAVAIVTANMTDEDRPMSSTTAVRSAQELPLRVFAVQAIWWSVTALIGACLAVLVLLPEAETGMVDWIDFLSVVVNVLVFVAAGFLFGRFFSRWFAGLLALFLTGIAIWVMPGLIDPLLEPTAESVGREFLFPGTPGWQHEPYNLAPLLVIFLWWTVVIAALVSLGMLTARRRAGLRGAPSTPLMLSVLALGGFFLLLTAWRVPLFSDLEYQPSQCEEAGDVTVCLAPEEVSQTGAARTAVVQAIERVWGELPSDGVLVESVQSQRRDPQPPSSKVQFVVPITAVNGAAGALREAATTLAGLADCPLGHEFTTQESDSIRWSLTLASWIAGDIAVEEEAFPDPVAQSLTRATVDEVRTWYAENEESLRSCTYTGNGP